ncbi:MAG: creatininase family protein [Balneolaceae bacterium]|nr:creatininase family protein [Balneolaceae bacterium]
MRPYILAESTWKEIKDQQINLAVLPWGATEAHNYHLPYATDNYQIDAIAGEAGRIAWEKGARVTILPVIPFGVNTGQSDIKLDMNLNPSTQLIILRDLVTVLNRQGIHKLLVLNGHGGNNFKPLLRELGLEFPKMFLSLCDWFRVEDKSKYFEEDGDHADEMETSLMMYLHPDLVRPLNEAGKGSEKQSVITGIREGWAWSERAWSMVTEDTGIGNPKHSTKEKGKRLFQALTQKVGDLMVEIDEMNPENRYR